MASRNWKKFMRGRVAAVSLATYARERQIKRIAAHTGLPYEEARELADFLAGPDAAKKKRQRWHAKMQKVGGNTEAGKIGQRNSEVSLDVQGEDATVSAKTSTIKTLDDLLAAADVDRRDWLVKDWQANKWDTNAGKGRVVELWQVKAWLTRKPDWAHQCVKPVRSLKRKTKMLGRGGDASRPDDVALIIPDSQNGYRVDPKTGYFDPLHDRAAWDLAIQVAEDLQPNTIVLLGDMLDLAPWSTKFPTSAALRFTTQPSLLELHWWLAHLRLVCPHARIVYIDGNHESRINRAIVSSLQEAEGVKPANDPDGPDALSVERLLALPDLDIEYAGPYGEGFWLWDRLWVHHGQTVKKGGGATVAAVLKNTHHSEVIGHIHRVEAAWKTVYGPDGSKDICAWSPGTITRVEPGIVPASTHRIDWQQALSVVYLNENRIFPSMIKIHEGACVWRGNVIRGRDRVTEIKEATGWRF